MKYVHNIRWDTILVAGNRHEAESVYVCVAKAHMFVSPN
jgi:hypothetical protein